MIPQKKLYFVWALATSLSLLGATCFGQQQISFTQYMFNGLAINPGYAGSDVAPNITAIAREQWLGFEGAPSNQMLSAHMSVGRDKKMGLGLSVERATIAVNEVLNIYAMYAYKINLGNKKTLAFGLQAGISQQNHNLSTLALPPGVNDPSFNQNVSRILPNFGTGIYFSSKRLYAGISAPTLIKNELDDGDPVLSARQARHYFVHGGYLIDLSPTLKLKPNFLIKVVNGVPFNLDVNANLLIKERVWVGFSYRNLNGLSGILEILVSNKFRVGFGYDFITSDIADISDGSVEVMLNYRFLKNLPNRIMSPRYF